MRSSRPRSARSLAREAYDEVYRADDPQSKHQTIKTLAELYNGTYQKKVSDKSKLPSRHQLRAESALDDDIALKLQLSDLKKIADILAEHRVKLTIEKLQDLD